MPLHSLSDSLSTAINMALEIVSLGFHMNEEHGEMFIEFYDIFWRKQ